MSDAQTQKEPENLPRVICAFSGLFALGVPAFSVIVGAKLQPALAQLAESRVFADSGSAPADAPAFWILNACGAISWALLAIGVLAAVSLFALMRKNSSAGTLRGAGRVALMLGLTSALSAFYLAALVFAAAFCAV